MAAPTKEQLLKSIKLEPASEEELRYTEQIEAGEYEVYSEKLNNITREASEVFSNLAVGAGIRGGDNVVGIYTAAGDLVSAWCGTYLHAAPGRYHVSPWRVDTGNQVSGAEHTAYAQLDEHLLGLKEEVV